MIAVDTFIDHYETQSKVTTKQISFTLQYVRKSPQIMMTISYI